MKKRVLALVCALGMWMTCPAWAAGEATPAAKRVEVPYSDMTGDEWFAPAVAEVTRRGLMSGVEGGRFGPDRPVNRANVIMALWWMEGAPLVDMEKPFTDAEEWYIDAAKWAKSAGIASGYAGTDPNHPAGSFGGRDLLNREQLAVFLYRYAQYKGDPIAEGVLGLYSDAAQVSDWAQVAMRHAVGMGILQGDANGALNPQGVANRAALAVILDRMLTPVAG